MPQLGGMELKPRSPPEPKDAMGVSELGIRTKSELEQDI